MSSEKIRVPFPIKGLDKSTQLDAQPPGTTRDARNVRGICPRTGRNRGAQRAPVEKYTTDTGPGSRTQALAVVSYDEARNKYTQLNNEPNADVSPTDVINGIDWAKSPVEGALYSVVTDIHGNIYTLSGDRMIYKHSPDGELLASLSIVGYSSEEVVRRIQVDPLGNIYAATSTDDNSTLYRFEPDEDIGYSTRYRWKSTDKIIDFHLKFNQIYHVSERTTGDYRSYLAILYNLDSDIGPYTIFQKPVPSPVSGVAVGENGAIYVTCPKNIYRNTTPDSDIFGGGVISWTPHELGYNGETGTSAAWDGYKRIHAWLDGQSLSGVEGDEVGAWADTKQEGTKHSSSATSSSSPFEAIADSHDRSATCSEPLFGTTSFWDHYPNSRRPPTFFVSGNVDPSTGQGEAGGFGGKKCLSFDGEAGHVIGPSEGTNWGWWSTGDTVRTGNALYWGTNNSVTNRSSDTVDNPNSSGLVPGIEGVPYTTFFVVRVNPAQSDRARCLFSVYHPYTPGARSETMCSWKLLVNVGHDGSGWNPNFGGGPGTGPPWAGNSSGSVLLTGNIHDHSGTVNGSGGTSEGSKYYGIKDGTYTRLGSVVDPDSSDTSEEKVFPERWDRSNANQGPAIPSDTLIIAVHHGGRGQTKKSCYRVNGDQVGSAFTFKGDEMGRETVGDVVNKAQVLGASSPIWDPAWLAEEAIIDDYMLYGGGSTESPSWSQGSQNQRTQYPTEDILPFSGWVAEVITVLGTGTSPANGSVPDNHIKIDDGNSIEGEEPTEVEKIEGYLAWKWGLEATLHPSHPYSNHDNNGSPPATTLEDGSEETDPGEVFSDEQAALRSLDPILAKYDGNNGELVWALSAAGMGHGVVADDKNQVITFGQTVEPTLSDGKDNPNSFNPTTGSPEADVTMRKIVDLGQTFSADDVADRKVWTINQDVIPENNYAYPQLLLDKSGDVYVPSDPDQTKHLGGGGVYKVNVADGSVDFKIPSPVNYFMEGANRSASGISTGIGFSDVLALPHRPAGTPGSQTQLYLQKFPNLALDPFTGEKTVGVVRDAPAPYPNTTWHENPKTGDTYDLILPMYRNLLYCDRVEPENYTVTHEVVQQIDCFMAQNALSEGGYQHLNHGWMKSCGSSGSENRDTAYMHAPDLTPPYNISGSPGSASYLSVDEDNTDGTQNQMRLDLTGVGDGGGDTRRVRNGQSYTFSVWIARKADVSRATGTRTGDGAHDYARVRILQYKSGGSREITAIYNFSDGTVNTHWDADGGSGTGTAGVTSFTAAKEPGSTETQIWDRVHVTMPYDSSYATGNLVCQIWPVSTSSLSIPSDGRGGMHVWGPMVIEGTTPVSHNHPSWGSLGPGNGGNPAWSSVLWLDGRTKAERELLSGNTGAVDLDDSVTSQAIEPGDELFYSFYVAKRSYGENGSQNGPTATDPNPATVDGSYGSTVNLWMQTDLKSRGGTTFEDITWHAVVSDGNTYVRNFDADEGTGQWTTQGSGQPYGYNVISEDAGDYWRFGIWMKFFDVVAGKEIGFFKHKVHNSGSVHDSKFVQAALFPTTGFEFFVNSGVHPNAPGGLQFPTPTLKPHEPNAGSCLSIAVPPKSVEVDEGALNDDSEFEEKQKSPEFVYFTQKGNEPTQYDKMIRKHRVVAATPMLEDDQSPRANKLISVNNGSLYKVQTPSEGGSSYTAITSGDSVLSADASQIQWVQHQDKLYFVDGKRTIVYDPVLETVNDLESKKAGTVPSKPRLIASWRNRLVLARTVDEPHNWHMSAVGDAENWDYFPALPVVTQAVSGNNARAGLAADMINTLIPYNDDLMIMGGDHSISRMTGDPMAGGQIDVISQTIGMAFGQSWTMDPEGVLYFVSTESRIYAMTPDGKIQKISNKYIEDAVLEHWNESEFRMKLVWNSKDGGLHVLFLPNSLAAGQSAGIGVDALFYERVNNAWWRDQFAAEVVPYSAIVRDGDSPQDRTVLFGNEDGTVLNWAKQSVNSTTITDYNDNAINAWVFIDIASETSSQSETLRCTSVETIMSHYTQDAKIRLYADDNPLTLPDSEAAVEWAPPGRSGRLPLRAKGANLGLKISATGASGAFSTESIHVTLTKAGRSRV